MSDLKSFGLMFQEVLSVSVGPRADEEVFTVHQIESLLDRVGLTLGCRKVIRPPILLQCTNLT